MHLTRFYRVIDRFKIQEISVTAMLAFVAVRLHNINSCCFWRHNNAPLMMTVLFFHCLS